ncbi:MAG: tetratricopeptide repeat protein [Candidatus Zixiibacteriota bacterium]
MKCPKCSSSIADGVKFCPECGSPIAAIVKQEPSTGPKKSNTVRDAAIIVGVLAVVTAAYFLFKEKPEPPMRSEPNTPSAANQMPADAASGQDSPHDEGTAMNSALLDSLPKDYNSLVQFGNNYMDHGNYAVAAECYRRALAISEESQDVRVDYGACLHGMGLADRAIDEFRKVLAKNAKHPIANYNMGIVYSEIGKQDSMKVYMKKYLALDPNGLASESAKSFLKKAGD